ncbi:TetR/AcrR family transcriptional regulator [Nonomuraea sp. M3C6]|uniref:TetR/AcrR family transcriptional regulator n=1 Tax=Nonomuraea marmarensis TaxID=3351344 RepID=A0ABW7AUM0_9ACTN
MRTRDPDTKRATLINAGLTLAEEGGLGRLSVDKIVVAAGVAKGSFFHHFGNRAGFLTELHRRFHDRLAERIDQAIAELPPGRERLHAGIRAYLDGCRADRAVRALLVEARAESDVLAEVARRNDQFTHLVAPDFAAMDRRYPEAAAGLLVTMAAEVAVAESAADAALPELRAALLDYVD